MNTRTIAAIALSNRDFPSFEAKLVEAARWVEQAARQGADLAVLPEAMNYYRGDGPGNAGHPAIGDAAVNDWRTECATLLDTARRCGIALALPVVERELSGVFANVVHYVDAAGRDLGRYKKMYPAPEELDSGVEPGDEQPLLEWDGLKIGSAICFDTCFPEMLEAQSRAGADLIVVCSLWPGGSQLDYIAKMHGVAVALAYPAWSRILDHDGRELAATGYRNESLRFGFGQPIALATLNFDRVKLYGNHNQQKIDEVQQAYGSDIRVTFDQPNCCFYLESRSPDVTANEVVKRFGLIPFRHYFDRCRQLRDSALAALSQSSAASSNGSTVHVCASGDLEPIERVRRITADGRHNAFTDLLEWNGTLYLTYRRSSGHGETDGDVVLLRSFDRGESWSETPTALREMYNFYEGHLCTFGDRLLMFGGSFRRGGRLDKSTQQEFVSWSSNGVDWSPAQAVYHPRWRFWRPIRIGDRLYAAAYHIDYAGLQPDGVIPPEYWTVKLVSSADGVTWDDVATISETHGGNETELFLDDDGQLRAYMRCESLPRHLLEWRSRPPYTHWTGPIDGGQCVQGQTVRKIDGRRFMVGRHIPCHDRSGSIHGRRDWIRTRVWVQEDGYWIDYATLPSGGDTSYAGIAPLGDNRMLVSYYSQHDYLDAPGFQDMHGSCDIYLATLRTDAPARWGRVVDASRRARQPKAVPVDAHAII